MDPTDQFSICVSFTLQEEGGYSDDRNDPGNWTGGAVGSGIFKGTKYGISAKAYPGIDIAALTEYQAGLLYQRDYWAKAGIDLAPGVNLMVFDYAVNAGVSRSAKQLQALVGAYQDGNIGPKTKQVANNVPPPLLIDQLAEAHESAYRALPTFPRYGEEWLARLDRAKAKAHSMVPVSALSAPQKG